MRNLLTWINQPVEDRRWIMWPELPTAQIYEAIQADLNDYCTVVVDFSWRKSVTISEARRLLLSVPRKHLSYFSLWGVNDVVWSTLRSVISGK